MKLNFKDLKQQKFSIDAEPSESVADVKQKVAADKGFDATAIKLIWSGKILADGNTIGSYEIKPADHIVCMVQKPKSAPVASKPPTTPATAPAQTPSAPAPSSSTATTGNAPATPSPAPATAATSTETPSAGADPAMLQGSHRQAAIENMENMGFERAQCERAMRAAFYNAERAVEYLLNGIPESAERQMAQQQGGAGTGAATGAAGTGEAAAATLQPQATPAQAPAGGDGSDEPVNLFEAAAAANQGGRGGAQGAGAGAGAGQGAGTNPAAGAGQGGAGAGATPGNLDFMRDNPTFQQLRQLVQQQPQMLEQVLQQVGNSNPQLAQMIASQPEAFMNLLMEGSGEGGEDAPLPPGAQSVSVTENERDAIERLCRLGFDRDIVIQAYFACDKNEELAANFLFENPDDDGGEQS